MLVQVQVQVAAVLRQGMELGSPIHFGGSSKHPRRIQLGLLRVVQVGPQLQWRDVLPAEELHLQMRLLLPMPVRAQLLHQLPVLPLPDRTVARHLNGVVVVVHQLRVLVGPGPDLRPGALVVVELPMPPPELSLGRKI